METLEQKMTRVNDAVSTIKSNLHFDQNAIIEDVAESTNLLKLMNLYVQTNEPESKDGIWIKADPQTHPYSTVKLDQSLIIPKKWRHDLATMTTMSGFYAAGTVKSGVMVGDYLFVSTGSKLLKYNYKTNALTTITLSKTGVRDVATNGVDEIYLASSGHVEIYNINTNTSQAYSAAFATSYTRTSWASCCYSAYDNAVYLLTPGIGGSTYDHLGKFDLATKTFTILKTYNSNNERKGTYTMFDRGDEIVVVSGKTGHNSWLYKKDDGSIITIDETSPFYTFVLDYSAHLSTHTARYQYYINMSTKKAYRIDKDTLEHEDITDELMDEDSQLIYFLLAHDSGFYGIIKNNDSKFLLTSMEISTPSYDDNYIIISQAPINRTAKATALWTHEGISGKLLQSFYDVYYYNKETGFDFTLPMYYGNGTEWIKFKN